MRYWGSGLLGSSGAGEAATAGSSSERLCGSRASPARRSRDPQPLGSRLLRGWGCRHRLRAPPHKTGSPAGRTAPAAQVDARDAGGRRCHHPRRNLSPLPIAAATEPPLRRGTAQRRSPPPWGHPARGWSNPCCRIAEKFEGRLIKSCKIAPLPAPRPGRCPGWELRSAGERGSRGAPRGRGGCRGALCPW